LRKYGKKEKPLSIREPSLETRNLVDLFPFFRDYEAVRQEVDNRLIGHGTTSLCGQGHIKCCHDPVEMSFIEAIYLSHTVNSTLDRLARQGVIQRALEAGQAAKTMMALRREGLAGQEFIERYREIQILCPLNEFHECLVFPDRPVACRVFDLPNPEKPGVLEAVQPGLTQLSRELLFAFSGEFPQKSPWRFLLWEVVSGKFIQTFFQYLVKGQ
ncbi:MAG: phosphatase, partial [Thermodesulfobacteriota bacterium]